MIKQNKNSGITIISLIITIIILLILSGTVYTINLSNNAKPYNNMRSDIKQLEDKALVYYNKYRQLPKIDDDQEWPAVTIEGKTYYKLDLSKLGSLTLNYGSEKEADDIYLINNNLEVYYYKGIEKSGELYHY